MKLRGIRRRHNARKRERLARIRAFLAFVDASYEWSDWDDELDRDAFCPACGGSGRDEWSDGILECEECDGEGVQWWR